MPKQRFAGKNYEVLCRKDDRWLVDSVHADRADALARAGELAGLAQHDAVRVVAEDDRSSTEAIIFEQEIETQREKAATVTAIQDAPLCREIADYYAYPARRTIGRLIRQYLNENGLTVLELLFDANHLTALRRMEAFFNAAISRVAAIQADDAGDTLAGRSDALEVAFTRIRDRARTPRATNEGRTLLADEGLPALIARSRASEPAENWEIVVLETMAAALRSAADWSAKLSVLLDIAHKGLDDESARLFDEVVAEICDGAGAVGQLLGHKENRAAAFLTLVAMAQGQRTPRIATDSLPDRLNRLSAGGALPLTNGVLLGRVARGMRDASPLTRDGLDADRQAMTNLIRSLASPIGLAGGPDMAEAVTRRIQTTFRGDQDLEVADAVERIQIILPSQAAGIGYLVSVLQSSLGRANSKVVLSTLRETLRGLTSLSSLMPPGTLEDVLQHAVEMLRGHVTAAEIPDSIRSGIEASLAKLETSEPASETDRGGAEGDRKKPRKPKKQVAFDRLQVLIVEDERFIRQLTVRLLHDLGCRNIHEAVDGADGLARFRQMQPPPDVILLDLAMPGMNGFRFIEAVRGMGTAEHSQVSILVLTGHGEEKAVKLAAKLGISGYLIKPISRVTLEKQVRRALG